MGLSDPPTSETELLQRRPSSSRDGVFPRQWIVSEERILYEARPGLFAMYWGRLIVTFLWALLGLVATAESVGSNWVGAAFLVFLSVGPLAWVLLGWQGRAYALTDHRVLATSGAISRTLEYARYDEIQRLTVGSSATAEIVFHLGAPGAGGRIRAAAGRPAKVVWPAVAQAQQVYQYVQDAFRLEAMLSSQREARAAFVKQALTNRVVCAYCGMLIDFDPKGSPDASCPRCGAPVRLSLV